ncbi:hypothetical protein C8J56DRAFT_792898 [Mycena floridula]|nr:hypothetical protein C8J56DRAFT_792898 [Mycena floridula]
MSSALILGATGQVGRHLLKELLSSPYFNRVGEYGRNLTELSTLSDGKDKLTQSKIDFENLSESGLGKERWDNVFIVLGTNIREVKDSQTFEKIDREYVINAATEARVPGSEQRLIYLSGRSANSNSSRLYGRSKGLTEEGLAALGYKEVIVVRAGFIAGASRPNKGRARLDKIVGSVTGLLSYVDPNLEIQVTALARALSVIGQLGISGLPNSAKAFEAGKLDHRYTVVLNEGATVLAGMT